MGNTSCAVCCNDLNKKLAIVQNIAEVYDAPVVSPSQQYQSQTPQQCQSQTPQFDTGAPQLSQPIAASSVGQQLPFAAEAMKPQKLGSARSPAGSDTGSNAQSAATDSTTASSTPDVGQAQQVVKTFVRAMVKGQEISVLAVDGRITSCVASLDRKLTTFSLARSGKQDAKKRDIPLEKICEVSVGEEATDEVELPLNDRCVTLMLEDGSAVGFCFDNLEERDTFALCISMFIDGRRGEMERKQAKAKKGKKV